MNDDLKKIPPLMERRNYRGKKCIDTLKNGEGKEVSGGLIHTFLESIL